MEAEKKSFSAALIWVINRVSMVDRLKVLLQWSTKAESSMVTASTSSNQVLMVVSDSWDISLSNTMVHTSAIEFNESAPFPRIMRFSLSFSGKIVRLIIPNCRRKVYSYTNTKHKIFFWFLNRFRKKIHPISGKFSEKRGK